MKNLLKKSVKKEKNQQFSALLLLFTCLILTSCSQISIGHKKIFGNDVRRSYYNGIQDDLLTAGLGAEGLAKPLKIKGHSLASLRRLAIHSNFNALIDTRVNNSLVRKHSGYEYVTSSQWPDGTTKSIFLVQVPDSFDIHSPCLVAAPVSGSRGIYGAIGTVYPWALNKNCAVVSTDKGAGTRYAFVKKDKKFLSTDLDGKITDEPKKSSFSLSQWTKKNWPAGSVLQNHAHSGRNPERLWGELTLDSIRIAFHILNNYHSEGRAHFTSKNTLVITASISNGGAATLLAAEKDRDNLIHGVVASEPNIQLSRSNKFWLIEGASKKQVTPRSLVDLSTQIDLYLSCAILSEKMRRLPLAEKLIQTHQKSFQERCQLLTSYRYLRSATLEEQAEEAYQKLLSLDITPGSLRSQPFNLMTGLATTINFAYLNSYSEPIAKKPLCEITAMTNEELNLEKAEELIAKSGGILAKSPTLLIHLKTQKAPEKARGFGLTTALCWRSALEKDVLVQQEQRKVFSTKTQTKPTIILHGRSDGLIHVNHSSRAYVARHLLKSKVKDRLKDNLRYYEVTNAQHFDTLVKSPVFAKEFVPLHFYFEQSLELMWHHLKKNQALPRSQVIATSPQKTQPLILKSPEKIIRYKNGLIIPKGF